MTKRTHLYAGCYTNASSQAIRIFRQRPDKSLEQTGTVESIEHASFLTLHPNGQTLYAVSETVSFDGEASGGIHAFSMSADGSLTPIGEVASAGVAPCHLSISPNGARLHVANYGSGSFAVYALNDDGTFGQQLGSHQGEGRGPTHRQESPHAHCIVPGPDLGGSPRPVFGVDLGLDRVERLDPDGKVVTDATFHLPAGTGPRHLTFHPELRLGFVVGELNSTVTVVAISPAGELQHVETLSTLPPGFDGESTAAEVAVHPNGRFLYVSNRGHDSIAVFELADLAGTLKPVDWTSSGGANPRHFTLTSDGTALWVANERSNSIVPFDLDSETGMICQRSESYPASEPVCLLFKDSE